MKNFKAISLASPSADPKEPKQYWFRAKRYGWGWGLPNTWQGWLSFTGFGVVLALATLSTSTSTRDEAYPARNLVVYVIVVTLDVVGLLAICYKYGEPPKWRWGKK